MTSIDTIQIGFRRCWRRLAVVDIGWKLLGLLILGPLAGLIFRAVLSLSGKSVLADEEIAFFFLGGFSQGQRFVWLGIIPIGVTGGQQLIDGRLVVF